MSDSRPLVVGLGGTTRPGSSSEKCLIKALEAAEAAGARTRMFDGRFLTRLPIFNPYDDAACAERDELVSAVREADGVILSTPGYHGSLSGLMKNALDSLEDLKADARPYLADRSVGVIVTADGAQAGGTALTSVRLIVHAMRGWPTPLGAALNGSIPLFDEAGEFREAKDAWTIATVGEQVTKFAQCWAR